MGSPSSRDCGSGASLPAPAQPAHPRGARSVSMECGAEAAGRGCGSPGASQRAKTHRSLPAPVSAQLPNSGTLAKLLRAGGGRRGADRTIAAERGERSALGLRGARADQEEPQEGFVLRHKALGSRSIGGQCGASGWPGLGTGGAGGDPPLGGGAVAEPGSPAGEQRKCRGVGAGPAPRPLLLAELLPPGGQAGGLTLGAGGRAAGPAGRGGADRPR